jgi:N-acetyl-anhydromuramyl-L-alanine amidase AmpD
VYAEIAIIEQPVSFGYIKKQKNKETKKETARTIDTVIVHATYNPDTKKQNLQNAIMLWKKYGVSPHYAIDREGQIYRLVPEKYIAYHAGKSVLPNGEANINTRSIGIELIYTKEQSPSEKQYIALNSLLAEISARYTINYVLGHNEIAKQRKTDPWNIDWQKVPLHTAS